MTPGYDSRGRNDCAPRRPGRGSVEANTVKPLSKNPGAVQRRRRYRRSVRGRPGGLAPGRRSGFRVWPHEDRCTRSCSDRRPRTGRPLAHGHRGRHVGAPHHVRRCGGDRAVVRLRAMRRAPAVRGLEVVLAHQSAHPLLRGTNPHDPQARRLIVNAREAETVRSIFRWYCELGSVRALRRRLLAEGVTSKRRVQRATRLSWRASGPFRTHAALPRHP